MFAYVCTCKNVEHEVRQRTTSGSRYPLSTIKLDECGSQEPLLTEPSCQYINILLTLQAHVDAYLSVLELGNKHLKSVKNQPSEI